MGLRGPPPTMTGALLTLACVVHLLPPAHGPQSAWDAPLPLLASAASVAFVLAAALGVREALLARISATAGVAGLATLWVLPRLDRPGWGFLVLLACSWLLTRVWPARSAGTAAVISPPHPLRAARAAAVTLLLAWIVAGSTKLVDAWRDAPTLPAGALIAALLAAPLVTGRPHTDRLDRAASALAILFPCIAVGAWLADLPGAPQATLAVLASALVLAIGRRDPDAGPSALISTLLEHPPRLLVLTFAVQCTLGGLLLVLPSAAARPDGIGIIDALFTSVSATCVTGLTVLDTERDFSIAGQLTILALIQVGGLGIMTFSAAAVLALSSRMSVRHEATAADLVGAESLAELQRALVRVLTVTFVTEGSGAAALTALFWWDGDSLAMATWRGVFTAISAFCNAGFGLQSDNLVRYAEQPGVLHVVAVLIILGGLGPAVITGLPTLLRRGRGPLSAKLVVVTTLALLVLPVPLFAALEWNGSFSHLGVADRLHNAWFLSVTLRTAGFNATDIAALTNGSVVVMILWMFIGGSPGSTAGGAKTTTVAVVALAARAAIQGREAVVAFGRSLSPALIYRAVAITGLSATTVGAATLVLLVTQPLDLRDALFEAASATGTVGLTLGATARLDDIGKIVIMACMFAGRVGPLTLLLMFDEHTRQSKVSLPTESVPVG